MGSSSWVPEALNKHFKSALGSWRLGWGMNVNEKLESFFLAFAPSLKKTIITGCNYDLMSGISDVFSFGPGGATKQDIVDGK